MSKKNFPLQDFYAGIYRRYDLVNRLFTLGMDQRWRGITAKQCLNDNPQQVIDLCCGTGDLAFKLRKLATQEIRITGYDFSHEMLDFAKLKAARSKLDDIKFLQGDAADMPFPDGSFDALTIGFGFRNLIYRNDNYDKHLSEISRILKKSARLFILESAIPSSSLIRVFYNLYLRLVLIPLGGLISGDWKAYKYLAHSSTGFYKPKELREILTRYRIEIVSVRKFFFGAANLIVATKK